MIELTNIEIPNNYVLIKPDKDYEKLKNGLWIGSTPETEARHYGIKGEVLLIPQKLVYRGKEIKALRDRTKGIYSADDLKLLTSFVHGSMEYKTVIEIEPGDRVWFDYMAHIGANTEKKAIEVEGHGECILVDYSMLFIRERAEEKVPINGWIWIKTVEASKELGNDLVAPDIVDSTIPKEAVVVKLGRPILEYLSAKDCDKNFIGGTLKEGDRIFFNEKIKTPLEYTLHETTGLERLYKIKRKDIYGVYDRIVEQQKQA